MSALILVTVAFYIVAVLFDIEFMKTDVMTFKYAYWCCALGGHVGCALFSILNYKKRKKDETGNSSMN